VIAPEAEGSGVEAFRGLACPSPCPPSALESALLLYPQVSKAGVLLPGPLKHHLGQLDHLGQGTCISSMYSWGVFSVS
jgi:hypothetical protein